MAALFALTVVLINCAVVIYLVWEDPFTSNRKMVKDVSWIATQDLQEPKYCLKIYSIMNRNKFVITEPYRAGVIISQEGFRDRLTSKEQAEHAARQILRGEPFQIGNRFFSGNDVQRIVVLEWKAPKVSNSETLVLPKAD